MCVCLCLYMHVYLSTSHPCLSMYMFVCFFWTIQIPKATKGRRIKWWWIVRIFNNKYKSSKVCYSWRDGWSRCWALNTWLIFHVSLLNFIDTKEFLVIGRHNHDHTSYRKHILTQFTATRFILSTFYNSNCCANMFVSLEFYFLMWTGVCYHNQKTDSFI